MRIGILGTGRMAATLGTHWSTAGHEIMIGGRDAAKARELATRLGGEAGTLAAAARFGEVALLAITATEAVGVAATVAEALAGRVLLDCTDPFDPATLTLLPEDGVVRKVAAAVPEARTVKAFNICAAEVYARPVFDGTPLAVPVCGDDDAAVETVSGLVRDIGAEPVAAGGLARAALSEAAAVFVVGMWFTGADPAAILPPLKYAFDS